MWRGAVRFRRRTRRCFSFVVALLVLLGGLSTNYKTAAAPTEDESSSTSSSWYVRVNLPNLGTLQGIRSLGLDFFGGIPYAAPPVGNLRWAPPEEPMGWRPHVLDATHFGPDCYQVVDSMIGELPHKSEEERKSALQNEDLRKHFRDQAKRRTQNTLLLWHVSQKEDIKVTDEDVNAKIDQTLSQMGMPADA